MEEISKRVGFKEMKLEYEPVGAALNFGLDIKQDSNVLIFDFGGGTLDVCIMKFGKENYCRFWSPYWR